MKTFITVLAAGFLIWRINELANTLITINSLTLILFSLLLILVSYSTGYNSLHLQLINLYDRMVDWFSPVGK